MSSGVAWILSILRSLCKFTASPGFGKPYVNPVG